MLTVREAMKTGGSGILQAGRRPRQCQPAQYGSFSGSGAAQHLHPQGAGIPNRGTQLAPAAPGHDLHGHMQLQEGHRRTLRAGDPGEKAPGFRVPQDLYATERGGVAK